MDFSLELSGGFDDSPREDWELIFEPVLSDPNNIGSATGKFDLLIINYDNRYRNADEPESAAVVELDAEQLLRMRDWISEHLP